MADTPRRGPDPRRVAGYDRARELGLLPVVGAEPPAPHAPNSRRLLLAMIGSAFGGLLLMAFVFSTIDPPGWGKGLCAVGVAGAVVVLFVRQQRAIRAEIDAGYARFDEFVSLFSRDPEQRFANSTGLRGAHWNLRGLWRLDDRGDVVRPPENDVLPPGHYPSPHRSGELELWTGSAWAYEYRVPAEAFLDG